MAELTTAEKWVDENIFENREELMEIGAIANKILHDKLSCDIPLAETTIAMYCHIFKTILGVVKSKQDGWSDFCLNIADRLKVGYTTSDDDDAEKSGNYMAFIQHVENTQTDDSLDESETKTIDLCTSWCATNIKVQSDIVNEVAAQAKADIDKNLNIKLESLEFIIPFFCIVHAQLVNYIRLKRKELEVEEYEIKVEDIYFAKCVETNDGEEVIDFHPCISTKLYFKDDESATGANEG